MLDVKYGACEFAFPGNGVDSRVELISSIQLSLPL